jgi:hypothetical protein
MYIYVPYPVKIIVGVPSQKYIVGLYHSFCFFTKGHPLVFFVQKIELILNSIFLYKVILLDKAAESTITSSCQFLCQSEVLEPPCRAVGEAQASAHAISHHHNIEAARRAAEQHFVEEDRREALAAVADTQSPGKPAPPLFLSAWQEREDEQRTFASFVEDDEWRHRKRVTVERQRHRDAWPTMSGG